MTEGDGRQNAWAGLPVGSVGKQRLGIRLEFGTPGMGATTICHHCAGQWPGPAGFIFTVI